MGCATSRGHPWAGSPTLCKKAGWARHKEQARKQHSSIVCFTASLQPPAPTSLDDGPQAVRINPFLPKMLLVIAGFILIPGREAAGMGPLKILPRLVFLEV